MSAYFIFDGPTLICERIYFDSLSMFRQLLGGLNFRSPRSYLLLAKALRGLRSMSAAPA